jgi:N-acetyl-1-D-myo-inositol-2-amino-2-deoxy-alpha-D-glucopyranoside deacetylase
LFQAAVTALVEVIREVRPQVLVSYDEVGGYGHPDHIMAHRVATAAAAAAARPGQPAGGAPWQVAKFYWTAMPRSAMQRQLAALRGAADQPFELPPSVDEISSVVADELVTTVIHAPDQQPAKARALAAHATQVTVAGEFFALSNNLGQQVVGTEYFRLASGRPGGAVDADGRETDLFGGLLG